ncbi:histidine phosphatase family protein [Salibacter sp.]|jgi:phosphohistidine phosphatase|uniref:SixA phosphatase family protein n=1 Tax=Salibacter sp. TaxID=2010995 RepID=UPI002870283C|nr:histidine phosphatase family protein [Salibacter sp.]MDR9397561.1 histidine phosphatase family protein [Salibacter sp.]MDR9486977.1 histidine phosphatase family protein [Salibacter sp.]
MKTIYLIRHGKSSWKDTDLNDIDRSLKRRGVQDAYLIGEHLKNDKICPDLMISSVAVRAFHTAVIIARQLDYSLQHIALQDELYASSAEYYLEVISNQRNNASSIMLFGHDPALTNLYNMLLHNSVEKIPTCAVVAIEVEADNWQDIGKAKNQLKLFIKPKELK